MRIRSVRRQLAVVSWRASRDGRIYTRVAVDATALLAYIERERARTGLRVTVTHVVGAALARGMRAVPEARARVVFGRLVPVHNCDIGFAVDIDAGGDLAPVKICMVDEKSPAELAAELHPAAARLRGGSDAGHTRSSGIIRRLPWWGLRPAFALGGWLVGALGVAAFGQAGHPLGIAFVSNVGSLGLDEAFLAPLPFARVPVYLAVGAVRDAARVHDGQVAVRPELVLVATADHRVIDGAHAGAILRVVRELLGDPDQLDIPWSERLHP